MTPISHGLSSQLVVGLTFFIIALGCALVIFTRWLGSRGPPGRRAAQLLN
jgi:hypothetical protein